MAKNFFSGLFRNKDDKQDTPGSSERAPENAPASPAAPDTPDRPDAIDPPAALDPPAARENAATNPVPPLPNPPEQPEITAPAAVPQTPIPSASLTPFTDDTAADQATSLPVEPTSQPMKPGTGEPASPTPGAEDESEKAGWFSRLRSGLSRTSSKLSEGVSSIFTKRKLDEEALEELEELLITADLGVSVAAKTTALLAEDKFDKEITDAEVRDALAGVITSILAPVERPLTINPGNRPHVILMTGVNGAGKTTTIGKLCAKYKAEGKKVMLAAGDTFRAAAIEQLSAWGQRTGCEVIAKEVGADAAGLAFDALQAAKTEGADVLLIDTAGRLQNRKELMDELAKIVRVIRKIDPTAPHDTLLVLDATVGQNAISQAGTFREIAEVSGIVMSKLDGTARGGVLVALAEKFNLPVHFIGVGESVDDLQPFRADAFARALAGAHHNPNQHAKPNANGSVG